MTNTIKNTKLDTLPRWFENKLIILPNVINNIINKSMHKKANIKNTSYYSYHLLNITLSILIIFVFRRCLSLFLIMWLFLWYFGSHVYIRTHLNLFLILTLIIQLLSLHAVHQIGKFSRITQVFVSSLITAHDIEKKSISFALHGRLAMRLSLYISTVLLILFCYLTHLFSF